MENTVVIRVPDLKQWLCFRGPVEIVSARSIEEVQGKLEHVERRVEQERLWAAGFLSYEAAPAFDRALRVNDPAGVPLLWFGLYKEPCIVKEDGGALPGQEEFPWHGRLGLGPGPASPGPRETASRKTATLTRLPAVAEDALAAQPQWKPSISPEQYANAIGRIRRFIQRGDTYQVNYCFRLEADIEDDPWSFFCRLAQAHFPEYGAFAATAEWALCSLSPELFFRLEGQEVVCSPMKGTASRAPSWADDLRRGESLHRCPKNRAENVMIVDMVRNDLGRIAEPGSVQVRDLFKVERHSTVWQMTSTVSGRTQACWTEILRALFPPASVTGAPKPRTMSIIADLESSPRGVYTGTMGFLAPDGRAQFNVAIRTVAIHKLDGKAQYGIGGGITWDSSWISEQQEAFTKARVVLEESAPFDLLETLLWTPENGYHLLDRHLERLRRSAYYFSFPFDESAVLSCLTERALSLSRPPGKVRLRLRRNGTLVATAEALEAGSRCKPRRVRLAPKPVCSGDRFLYHKTTHRRVYTEALAACPDCDDVLLQNERGELTESTTANLMLEIDGRLYTPPLCCGLLAGVQRAWMIDSDRVVERVLTLSDLRAARRVFLVNSVRGQEEVAVENLPKLEGEFSRSTFDGDQRDSPASRENRPWVENTQSAAMSRQ